MIKLMPSLFGSSASGGGGGGGEDGASTVFCASRVTCVEIVYFSQCDSPHLSHTSTDTFLLIFSQAFSAASNVYKETALKGANIDEWYMNVWVSVFQLGWGIICFWQGYLGAFTSPMPAIGSCEGCTWGAMISGGGWWGAGGGTVSLFSISLLCSSLLCCPSASFPLLPLSSHSIPCPIPSPSSVPTPPGTPTHPHTHKANTCFLGGVVTIDGVGPSSCVQYGGVNGTNATCTVDCGAGDNPIYIFSVFIVFNITYNMLMLYVFKHGSSVLFVIANAVRLPLVDVLLMSSFIAGKSASSVSLVAIF